MNRGRRQQRSGALDLPRPVACVLSGGASLGAIQVGVLEVLVEIGLAPDLVVGTSVGAINGGYIAHAGFDVGAVERLAQIWTSTRTRDVFTGWGLRSVLGVLGSSGTLVSHQGLMRLLRTHLPASHAGLAVPMTAVATDMLAGEAVALSDGDLRANVLASASIPAVFPSVAIRDRVLVDGGVVANVPILEAYRLGARSLVVIDAGYPCMPATRPTGVLATTLQALSLMLRNQSVGALAVVAEQCPVLYVPPPCPVSVLPHDFSHAADLMALGSQAAGEFFEGLRIDGPGVYGGPHRHDMAH